MNHQDTPNNILVDVDAESQRDQKHGVKTPSPFFTSTAAKVDFPDWVPAGKPHIVSTENQTCAFGSYDICPTDSTSVSRGLYQSTKVLPKSSSIVEIDTHRYAFYFQLPGSDDSGGTTARVGGGRLVTAS
jgi:hypothetical protein